MRFTTEWHRGLALYLKLGDNPRLMARARELWTEAVALCQVQQWRETLDRRQFEDHFAPYSRSSTALQALLADSRRVALLAVSIGEALEQKARRYLNHYQPMDGYLLDRMGSFLAETAMRRLDRDLQQKYRACGRRVTRRFSPGYQDFDIKAQIPFVALIDARCPGLRVMSNGMLLPEKSITAVKGVFPAGESSSLHEPAE